VKAARLKIFFDGRGVLEMNSEYTVILRERFQSISVFVGSFHEENGHIDVNLLEMVVSGQNMEGTYHFCQMIHGLRRLLCKSKARCTPMTKLFSYHLYTRQRTKLRPNIKNGNLMVRFMIWMMSFCSDGVNQDHL
jgi:hypothetical protein